MAKVVLVGAVVAGVYLLLQSADKRPGGPRDVINRRDYIDTSGRQVTEYDLRNGEHDVIRWDRAEVPVGQAREMNGKIYIPGRTERRTMPDGSYRDVYIGPDYNLPGASTDSNGVQITRPLPPGPPPRLFPDERRQPELM